MRNIILAYIALVVIVIIIALFRGNIAGFIGRVTPSSSPSVIIKNQTFQAEIVDEPKEVQLGLSGRGALDQGKGMLFVFKEKGVYPFWMRDMKFPIDIIFINDTTIVNIAKNVQPPQQDQPISELPLYSPQSEANYVLEINAGLSDKYGIKAGDKVEFKNVK